MNCESLGKTVSPTKLTNIIHRESSREGLYKTQAGDIEVGESSIYHRHIEHFFTFLAGNTVFSLISDSPR